MKIKLDAADKFLEAVAVISVFATVAIIGAFYPGLPDIIPNHFDLNGVPNQYGSKNTLWAIVAVSVFIYMLTGIINLFPESFNYPSQKEDKESQYKLGSKLMRSLRAWILFFVTVTTYFIVQSAKTGSAKGVIWLIPFMLLIVFGHLIWFAVKWRKMK